MGRAMPSTLARTWSDLLTNWSHESSTNWTTSARSRAERHGRRVHPAASQTPHAQYAPTACVGRMQATRQACEPPDRCDTRPMHRGHRRTHEDKGIGMTKAHRHYHTDGMARAVGTSGSSARIWARTHRG